MNFGSVVRKEEIRQFSGSISGYIEFDSQGNQQVRNFSGRILGWYDKNQNVVRDFSGMIKYKGPAAALLLAER